MPLLTLLCPATHTVTDEALQAVRALCARHGLGVAAGWQRLSGASCSALELALQGKPPAEAALCLELQDLCAAQPFDLIYRAERADYRLAVFDMDSTLIQAEVIDELARAAGVFAQVAALTERAMRGELDFQHSFRARLALLRGLPQSALAEIASALPLMDGAERLFAGLRQRGIKTAILSGGFTYFAGQIQQKLGIDWVLANALDVQGGKLTGEAIAPIVDANAKAQRLGQLAAQQGISLAQCIAVGDGANDLPMLQLAGMGIAFHAKPKVRQQARHALSRCALDGILCLLGDAPTQPLAGGAPASG